MHQQSTLLRLIILCATLLFGCQGDDTTILSPQSVEAWENSDVTLTCSYTGTYSGYFIWFKKHASVEVDAHVKDCIVPKGWLQDASLYSYSCTSNKTQSVTLKSVTKEKHGDIWRCVFTPGVATFKSNNVSIFVSVPVNSVTITPNNIVTQEENTLIEWTCKSSACRPRPKFRWYIANSIQQDGNSILQSESDAIESFNDDIIVYTNKMSIKLNRTWNGWALFCGSQNRAEHFANSTRILINVQYPPDGPPRIGTLNNGAEIKVIKDEFITLTCSITGGNPPPTLAWNKNNNMPQIVSENVVMKNITWQAVNINKEELRCHSTQLNRQNTTYVSVNVLYPPDTPEIKIRNSFGTFDSVNKVLSIIEGLPFTLNCSADSNPPVSLFKWNNVLPTSSSLFNAANASRIMAKLITCGVSNVMQIDDQSTPVIGNNTAHLEVNVLYPPTVNPVRDKTITEGDSLNYKCDLENGNPDVTDITWNWKDKSWTDTQLQITNVSRNQAGLYRCNMRHLMISSDNTRVSGNYSGELHLYVKYKAKVLTFLVNQHIEKDNVTVNEHDTVNMTCEIEGEPLPKGEVLFQRASYFLNQIETLSRNFISQTTKNLLLTSSFPAQCTDAGIYTCSGSNYINNEKMSDSKQIMRLFVNCKPRKSTFLFMPDKVISAISADVTLSFTALAYPIPPESGYVWSKYVASTDSWVNITVGDHYTITTSGLQSHLTIKSVSQSDYGEYRLFIHNEVGEFNYTITLISDDTNKRAEEEDSASSPIVAGVAGAAGGLIFVVAAIFIVFFIKRRMQKKKQNTSCHYIGFNDTNEGYHGDQQVAISNAHEHSIVLTEKQPTGNDEHGLQEVDDYDENLKTDYSEYGNTPDRIKTIERVDVVELFPYLSDKTAEFFAADYAKLPQGLTKSYVFSQKPENIALNRYHGIYPYDHSRVKIAGIPDYFINASYIDGYKRKKAYIASLGPLVKTSKNFVMFWQMVWSEKSDVIVMLTKLAEPSGVKCEQYWPKDGTSITYGDVTVSSTGEEIFSDYVTRTFSVSKGGQKRKLTHFHFMAWPDKSIPEDVTCLLEFRHSVRANHSSGPLIVHCSAGIGRTGTLIAIDILIEEGQKKGSVNVLECVKTMREQRTNMVQTLDQYYYIFKALVNALVFDNEAIPADKIHKYTETSKVNRFSDMFQKLNMSVESETTIQSNSRMINKAFKDRNRAGSDIPGDAHRVRLYLNRGMDASDYFNATYLNSFRVADHFIVAQTPLLNGVEDFLCLIYQEKCSCVVSMDGDQTRQDVGLYFPPDNANFSIGSFNVHCSRLETKETYIVRKMKIECTGQLKGVEKVVYHFEFLGWLDGNKVPNDPQQFVEFTKDVERFAGQFGTEGSHVLVHCLSAFERSCLFCAVVNLTEKIKHENEVCIPNTLRQIRTRRKLAIPTLEQFRFCYQAADAYVSLEKAGTNNAENSYMNVTMNS